MQQAGAEEIIILAQVAQEQHEVVDIFLEKTDEENATPKQQSPADEVVEEIEVEKADPSPPRTEQAKPFEPNTEENDKIKGELNASWEKTPPVTSSGAPTRMDVDPAPLTTAPQLVEEEKKFAEPMAREETASPAVPHATKKEVVLPPTEET